MPHQIIETRKIIRPTAVARRTISTRPISSVRRLLAYAGGRARRPARNIFPAIFPARVFRHRRGGPTPRPTAAHAARTRSLFSARDAGILGLGDGKCAVIYRSAWTVFRAEAVVDAARVRVRLTRRFGRAACRDWIAEGAAPAAQDAASKVHFTARLDHTLVAGRPRREEGAGRQIGRKSPTRARRSGSRATPGAATRLARGPYAGAGEPAFRAADLKTGRLKDAARAGKTSFAPPGSTGTPRHRQLRSGLTAAIVSLALAASGHGAAAVYDGLWSAWGAREDFPVVVDPPDARRPRLACALHGPGALSRISVSGGGRTFTQQREPEVKTMAKYKLEYIWLDGYKSVQTFAARRRSRKYSDFPTL